MDKGLNHPVRKISKFRVTKLAVLEWDVLLKLTVKTIQCGVKTPKGDPQMEMRSVVETAFQTQQSAHMQDQQLLLESSLLHN